MKAIVQDTYGSTVPRASLINYPGAEAFADEVGQSKVNICALAARLGVRKSSPS
jgi:hypothetical protein